MIIGFSGGMGVGKSTAVNVLRANTDRPVYLIKFAQPLYDMQELIYNRIRPVYERPESFVKDRKLLQWLGTEWGRDTISKTLWVDLWKARAGQVFFDNPRSIIVCDDVRFDNEAETIKGAGGQVVLLTAKGSADRAFGGEGIKQHSSEAGIDGKYVDHHVDNSGTLDNFKAKLCVLYRDLLTERSK